MSAPERLTQVMLTRASGPSRGCQQNVCWIDSKLAVKGRKVRDLELEADGAPWGMKLEDCLWVVTEVYNTRLFADVEKQRSVWKRWADVLK